MCTHKSLKKISFLRNLDYLGKREKKAALEKTFVDLHSLLQLMKYVRFSEKCRNLRNSWIHSPKFRKLREAIWLSVINEIFQFPPHSNSFCQTIFLNFLEATPITHFESNTFALDFRLLESYFVNYRKPYG